MRKNPAKLVIALALLLALGGVLSLRWQSAAEQPKRRSEKEVLVYQDTGTIELWYRLPEEARPVNIYLEILWGDGPNTLAGPIAVQPGETVTQAKLLAPLGVPAVYGGRISAFDAETETLYERVGVELRIYAHRSDPYDSLPEPEAHELVLDGEEGYRPESYAMVLEVRNEELRVGYYGLRSEARDLHASFLAFVDDREVLLAEGTVGPRSICFYFSVNREALEQLETGRTYIGRVDSVYADTGEPYETVPATVEVRPGSLP